MVGSLFTQVFCSQPNGVSLCGRTCCRTPANELPDPHFEIKQFAFRVASPSADLPLEEPLLGKALDANGNPYRSVRPAPVEEPHTVLPCLPEATAGEGLPPGRSKTVRLLLRRVAGVQIVGGQALLPPAASVSDPLRSASSRRPCGAGIPSPPHGPNRDNRSRP